LSPDTFNVADVVAVDTSSGEVRLRVGDAARELGFADNCQFFSAGGFISAPNLPGSNGEACQALYVKDGDSVICIGTVDNRFAPAVGSLKPGDWAIVSDCTSRLLLKQATDTISIYAENQKTSPVGQAMLVQHDAKNGVTLIMNGEAFAKFTSGPAGGEIELTVNGGGSIRIHKGGVSIVGGDITLIGGFVRLGDMGGGTAVPPSPTNSVALGPGGPVNIVSTKVFAAN
jgi:hypothetical protein